MGYKAAVCFAVSAVAFAVVSEAFADPYPNFKYSGGQRYYKHGGASAGNVGRSTDGFSKGRGYKSRSYSHGGGSTRVVQQYKTIYIPVANPYPPAGNYRKAINRPVMKSRK